MKIVLVAISISWLLFIQATAQPPVVTYPNRGEMLTAETTVNTTWNGTPNSEMVGIDYIINNLVNIIWLITEYPSSGTYPWGVPDTPSPECKIEVFGLSFNGTISNQFFTITNNITSLSEVVHPLFPSILIPSMRIER